MARSSTEKDQGKSSEKRGAKFSYGISKEIPNHSVSYQQKDDLWELESHEPLPVKKITFTFKNSRSTIDLTGSSDEDRKDDHKESVISAGTRIDLMHEFPVKKRDQLRSAQEKPKIPIFDEPINAFSPLPLRNSFMKALTKSLSKADLADVEQAKKDDTPAIYLQTSGKLRLELYQLRYKKFELSFLTSTPVLRESYWKQITAEMNTIHDASFKMTEYIELAEYLEKEVHKRKPPKPVYEVSPVKAPAMLPVTKEHKKLTKLQIASKELKKTLKIYENTFLELYCY